MDFPLIKEGLEQHPSLYVTEYQNVPTLPNSSPYYCSKVELHLVTGMAADGENYTMWARCGEERSLFFSRLWRWLVPSQATGGGSRVSGQAHPHCADISSVLQGRLTNGKSENQSLPAAP
ncbi:hypothetical protein MCOR34_004706 [Pyricularia oryzae]|nr:hypothetical protein MCOR34_004706 [Pyricularia oryzae]KAI6457976.1 hypothetical protein MCOR17_007588 [Pyricularia oryzae]